MVKDGSLALHPSWEEKQSLKKSREIYQFTNLQKPKDAWRKEICIKILVFKTRAIPLQKA